jgi:hypothetical protein
MCFEFGPRTLAASALVALGIHLAPTPAACAGQPPNPDGSTFRLGPAPKTLELFLPGVVSTPLYERDIALSPDGNEIYFGVLGNDFSAIAVTRWVDGRWPPPEIAPFSGGPITMDLEPAFSTDGRRLYFLSTRPDSGKAVKPGWAYQDIWYVERSGTGWGEPKNLGPPVNSDQPEFFPTQANNGALYFTRGVEGHDESAIWRARWVDGHFATPEKLPPAVNCTASVFNAAIAPDESFLLTCVTGKESKPGGAAYYVNFHTRDDRWSDPVALGPAIGLPADGGISVSISRDGRILFFASTRRARVQGTNRIVYRDLQEDRQKPGNGNSDVYWIDAAVLEPLRPPGF